MKKRCLLILCILTLVLRGIEAEISASPSRPVAGESFMVQLTVDTAQNFSLELPELPAGVQISSRAASRSMKSESINGRHSTRIEQGFPAIIARAGSYRIPPFTLDFNGKKVKTNALEITVRDAASLPDDEKISAVLTIIPPRKVYVGEMLFANVELFVPDMWQLQGFRDIQLENVGTPFLIPVPGQQGYFEPVSNAVRRGRGIAVELRCRFQVLSGGEFQPECKLELLISKRSGYYDSFFAPPPAVRTITAYSPAKLQILPRPAVPAKTVDTGLTGQWETAAAFSKSELRAGDIAELTLTFAGNMPAVNFKAPEITIPDARVYPPETSFSNQQKTITVKYPFVPLKAGKFTLPLAFAVLNPLTGKYIISDRELTCTVSGNPALTSPAVPAVPRSPAAAETAAVNIDADLAPLELLPPGGTVALPLFNNVKLPVIILIAVGILILVSAFIPGKKKNPRQQKALKKLISAVKRGGGKELLDSGTAEIAEALGLPPGSSPAEIAAEISDPEVQEFFHRLSSAAYDPSRAGVPDTPQLRKKLVKFLKSLLAAAILLGSPLLYGAEYSNAQTAFYAGDYAAAQKILQELSAKTPSGTADPHLLYDLGCAEYMCGNYARAYVNFRRASLLKPADIRFSQAAALAEKNLPAGETVPAFINQIAIMRPDTAVLIAAAAFLAFTILIFFRRKLNPLFRHAAQTVVIIIFAAAIGWSAVIDHYLYDPAAAVVTASRCELSSIPARSGGSRSALPPGTRVRIGGENGSFYRVTGSDISGWLPKEDVERIFFK